MFKLRSIAARLILAITLTAAVACGVLGTFSIIQQRSLTRLALDQQLKLQYDSVMAALDYEGRAALAVSAVIANLPPVADAVAKGERDPLMALLHALRLYRPQRRLQQCRQRVALAFGNGVRHRGQIGDDGADRQRGAPFIVEGRHHAVILQLELLIERETC